MYKLLSLVLLCLFVSMAASESLRFVFQYNTHGERTPLFTADPRFNVTRNNYKLGNNQLTLNGLRNSFSQGENFKKQYAGGRYFEGTYSPSDYFIRALPDNPSVMSAYAFMLGTDPTLVDGLGLVEEKGTPKAVTDDYVIDARRALYLDRPLDDSKPVYIHSGNSDGFFFKDTEVKYKKLKKDLDNNVKEASKEFENKHGTKLYYKLSSLMNVPRDQINFSNIAQYLDDFICSYSNNLPTDPFEFDADSLEMVDDYFKFLIKYGLLRDNALNKVIAHPFLYSLLREMLFKAQPEEELNQWEGPCVSCKYSISFGNRLTYLAALRVLGVDNGVSYNPGWGDQLTFELHQDKLNWFVRIYNNDAQVFLDSANGDISLDQFRQYVCDRLYFGNLEAVAAGAEDYHQMAILPGGSCTSLAKTVPLFGCKKKESYEEHFNSHPELGWTREELSGNEGISRYGKGRMHNAVIYLGGEQSGSSSSTSYSWSSDSSDVSQPGNSNDGSSYSYSWSSDDSDVGTSSNDGSSSGYSWSSESSSGSQPSYSNDGSSSSYSWSSDDSDVGTSSSSYDGGSYGYSSSSGYSQPASSSGSYSSNTGTSGSSASTRSVSAPSYSTSQSSTQQRGSQYSSQPSSQVSYQTDSATSYDPGSRQMYTDPTVAKTYPSVNTKYIDLSTKQDNEYCAIEPRVNGFREVARTEVDVPVMVKKPVTTYIEEEECRTVTIPTYRKDFNPFRVAPIKIQQNKHIVHEVTKCATDFIDEEISPRDARWAKITGEYLN